MLSVRKALYGGGAMVLAAALVMVGYWTMASRTRTTPVAGTVSTAPSPVWTSEKLQQLLPPPSAHDPGSTITELTLAEVVANGLNVPPADLVVTPARCADGLGDGVGDPARTLGWAQFGSTPSGALFYSVAASVDGGAKFDRIRQTIAACAAAQVTLTSFGITGTLTLREFAGPALPGAQTIGVEATTNFPAEVPEGAQALITALGTDAVYVAQGSLLLQVCEPDVAQASQQASQMYGQLSM